MTTAINFSSSYNNQNQSTGATAITTLMIDFLTNNERTTRNTFITESIDTTSSIDMTTRNNVTTYVVTSISSTKILPNSNDTKLGIIIGPIIGVFVLVGVSIVAALLFIKNKKKTRIEDASDENETETDSV